MTRAQILNLITQYIYTNGNENITAAQLNEILSEMAESFAMIDEMGIGIDEVLEAGNSVSIGREITNGNGGILKLDATETIGETYVFNYMGFENSLPDSQGVAFIGQGQSALGSVKRDDPSRNLLNMASEPLLPGENLMGITCISNTSLIKPCVLIQAVDDQMKTTANYSPFGMYMNTEDINSGDRSYFDFSKSQITQSIYSGPQSSFHIQTTTSIQQKVEDASTSFYSNVSLSNQTWGNQTGEIANFEEEGLKLRPGKTIDIQLSGSSTSGVTLSSDSTGGILASPGPTSSMKISANQTTLESSSINFKTFDTSTVYATLGASGFAIGPVSIPAKISVYQNGVSTVGLCCENNATGNNVAIIANSFNGEINTAFLAPNGNIVALNGSAMFGFGSGLTVPSARMDIKSQGTASTDLALRVRHSDNTKNIVEVRGNGDTAFSGSLIGTSDFEFNILRGFALDACQMATAMNYNGQDQYNATRIHLRGNSTDEDGTNVINIGNGTVPVTSNDNAFRMYAADQAAGNSVPHFLTENGSVVKIYQETTAVGDARFASGGGGDAIKDTDTFDGYTLKQIVKALRNLGILQ